MWFGCQREACTRRLRSGVSAPAETKLGGFFARLCDDGHVRRLIELARDEDLGPSQGVRDVTSLATVDATEQVAATVVARSGGVLAGLRCVPLIIEVFGADRRVSWTAEAEDGEHVAKGAAAGQLAGFAHDVLAIERTLLNLVGRLSGIATRTDRFVKLVKGTRARVLDTRKTTPGLRALEKYAVRCGGGYSHRLGLYDAMLIKDNHLAHVPLDEVASVVAAAARKGRELAARHRAALSFIECEVDSLEQLAAILAAGGCGVNIVLLDNMPPEQMREAVGMRDRAGVNVELEASGGVNEQTIRSIAETGVDRISVGGLTHQAVSLDVALDVQ